MSKKLKLVIAYQWLDREIRIAEVWDSDLLGIAKERALQDAHAKLQLLKHADPIVRIEAEAELKRIQKMLGKLISSKHESEL